MSLIALLGLMIFIVYLVSLFGAKISPEHSLKWWIYFGFLILFAIKPESLRPLADLFGIALTGNLFLACTCLFLLFQCLESSSETWTSKMQVRTLVAQMAAKEFLKDRRLHTNKLPFKSLVVLPCYNEEICIEATIEKLRKEIGNDDLDFCVVDDGSDDQTKKILERVAPHNHTSHEVNLGVSGALLTGFKICLAQGYSHCIQFDSDGQHPAQCIKFLIDKAHSDNADLVIASRYLNSSLIPGGEESTTFARQSGSVLLRLLLKMLFNAKVTDPTSGFRIYSRNAMKSLLKNLPQRYPEPESVAILALKGLRISEMEVQMNPRQGGVSSLAGKRKAFQFMLKVSTSLAALKIRKLIRMGSH